jgi:hypothetical protein
LTAGATGCTEYVVLAVSAGTVPEGSVAVAVTVTMNVVGGLSS